MIQSKIDFSGSDYAHKHDFERLTRQQTRIYNVMNDGKYRTLREIEDLTGAPQASISAQLRHLKSQGINYSKRIKQPSSGLWEYRLEVKRVD